MICEYGFYDCVINEEAFNHVLQRFHDDFRKEELHSYDYIMNIGRIKVSPEEIDEIDTILPYILNIDYFADLVHLAMPKVLKEI